MISCVSFPIIPLLLALLLDVLHKNYDLSSEEIKCQARTISHSQLRICIELIQFSYRAGSKATRL